MLCIFFDTGVIDRVKRLWEISEYSHGKFTALHGSENVVSGAQQQRCCWMSFSVAREPVMEYAVRVDVFYHLVKYYWVAYFGEHG